MTLANSFQPVSLLYLSAAFLFQFYFTSLLHTALTITHTHAYTHWFVHFDNAVSNSCIKRVNQATTISTFFFFLLHTRKRLTTSIDVFAFASLNVGILDIFTKEEEVHVHYLLLSRVVFLDKKKHTDTLMLTIAAEENTVSARPNMHGEISKLQNVMK